MNKTCSFEHLSSSLAFQGLVLKPGPDGVTLFQMCWLENTGWISSGLTGPSWSS